MSCATGSMHHLPGCGTRSQTLGGWALENVNQVAGLGTSRAKHSVVTPHAFPGQDTANNGMATQSGATGLPHTVAKGDVEYG